jgi:hypothetical protein
MDLKEEFAGEVAVDAAIIMIGDPYYSLCNKGLFGRQCGK